MPRREVRYVAAPTLRAFHESGAFVRGVMGPLGSGKSSAMCLELLRRARQQPPGPDGLRRSRFAVVRNTYPELRTTTLRTWADWAPPELCPVSASAPMTGRLRARLDDATRLDMEVLFLALDRPGDARKLLSLELTGAWINEAREVDLAVLQALAGRVGRYPPRRLGPLAWSGVIMDTNPPDEDHWWHRLAEEQRPEGHAFFRQPPALLAHGPGWRLNPAAENVANQPLGGGYWLRQVAGKARPWIDVYLLGAYGAVCDGRPVYPEYDDARHPAGRELAALAGQPLLLGWDFGLTPACVAVQLSPTGQLLVLAEWAAESMGIRRFAREVVGPEVRRRFPGLELRSYGDPAGAARAQTDERTCFEELTAAGLPTAPARGNDFTARREAVAGFLAAQGEGQPGLRLSSACPLLRRGFTSGYRLARLALATSSGEVRHADRPDKNRYSHVHDALQYAAMAAEDTARLPSRPGRRPLCGIGDAQAGY